MLRDGCKFVVVDDDDFLMSYHRKLDFYIDSEAGADSSTVTDSTDRLELMRRKWWRS